MYFTIYTFWLWINLCQLKIMLVNYKAFSEIRLKGWGEVNKNAQILENKSHFCGVDPDPTVKEIVDPDLHPWLNHSPTVSGIQWRNNLFLIPNTWMNIINMIIFFICSRTALKYRLKKPTYNFFQLLLKARRL